MTELKPCPFCGGKAMLYETQVYTNNDDFVVCLKCGCRTPIQKRSYVIKIWNTRSSEKGVEGE